MHASPPTISIRRRTTAALLVLAGATLTNLVPPAVADSGPIYAKEHRAAASFMHVDNTMDVCDTAYDGASAAVQRGDHKIIAVNYWGSLKYNGCRRWHIKGRNGSTFKYRVCPAYHARKGGKRITLSKYFCSGWQADVY